VKSIFLLVLSIPALSGLACRPLLARQKTPDTYIIQLPPRADYSPMNWLLGDWTGKTSGKGEQGQVLLSASYDLDKRFMVLREEISLPATKTAPATRESLMGIVSAGAGGSYEMNLYSSSGFVTHYRVTAKHGEIDFSPEGGFLAPAGWLFRRVLRHTNPGQCVESVDVAPPQQAFFNYYTATLSRVTVAPAGGTKDASKSSTHEERKP
jgi:hypothetical protein